MVTMTLNISRTPNALANTLALHFDSGAEAGMGSVVRLKQGEAQGAYGHILPANARERSSRHLDPVSIAKTFPLYLVRPAAELQ